MAHEIAHQAGYNEDEAVYLQRYLAKSWRRYSEYPGDLKNQLWFTEEYIKQTLELIQNQATFSRICGALGRADGFLWATYSLGQGHYNEAVGKEEPITPVLTLYEGIRSRDSMGYCGLPPEISEMPGKPIPFKDSTALVAYLNEMLALIDQMKAAIASGAL